LGEISLKVEPTNIAGTFYQCIFLRANTVCTNGSSQDEDGLKTGYKYKLGL